LDEYHLDGLRVDAIHCMGDDSEEHITRQMGHEIRQWATTQDRPIWLIAETNVYDEQMTVPVHLGGSGFDAQWCDDYLHSVFANIRPGEQLTSRVYRPQVDLAQTLKHGFVFSGNVRGYRGRLETEELARPVDRKSQVICIQNHDFIGNHPLGKRLHQLTSPASQAAVATLTLMMPCIPMIFMGEEFACESPFNFFVDFGADHLKKAVVEGRQRDYPQHDWSDGVLPIDPAALHQSKIGAAADGNLILREFYQTLLRFRRQKIEAGQLRADTINVRVDAHASLYRVDYDHGSGRWVVLAHLLPYEADESKQDHDLSSDLLQDLPTNLCLDSRLPFGWESNRWAGQHTRIYG
jgi:maltooligosyltrehalose trehalohydrolase